MAKSKKKEAEPTLVSSMDSLLAEIDGEYGAGIVRPGSEIIDHPRQVIPVGPALDTVLGGGIPGGSWVLMSGPPKAGKTLTALCFAANCQRPEYGGRPVMVLSAEHRLDALTLGGIAGLKTEAPYFYFVESARGRILGADDFLNIGLKFLKSCPGGLLIVDSVSSLVNPKTISDGLGSSDYGSGNRLSSQFCDLAAPIVKAQDSVVFAISQLYVNTSGYGSKWAEKAATKFKYQADVMLACTKFEYAHGNGEDEPPTGQTQHWLCKKSALCGPGGKVESHIRYGVGIDKTLELIERAKEFGLVTAAGSWMTLDYLSASPELLEGTRFEGKDAVKEQGAERVYHLLEEHPAWLSALERGVRSVLWPEASLAG
jgi:RecA/RadA recombinase